MDSCDLPIKMLSFHVGDNISDVEINDLVDKMAWDLRHGEAAMVKIIYPQGKTHRFYIHCLSERIIWTEGPTE